MLGLVLLALAGDILSAAGGDDQELVRLLRERVRTVELNAPFYRWPKPATVRRWKRDAPKDFIYTVKVNQLITHERRMVRTHNLVRTYYDEIAPVLGDKMGCFLFQFPPGYHYRVSRLKSIVTQLDPTYRNVVEFRHRSWWRESVYRALAERGIAFCAVNAPRLRK